MSALRIDSHNHFWRYSASGYGWIDDSMDILKRDYLPTDLEQEGVMGTIAVQARQILEETRWLLSLTREHPFIRGVIGWVPLCENTGEPALEEMASDPLLKGVRHVLHDEPNPGAFMLRDDFNAGVSRLHHYGLVYDVLVFAEHLPATTSFIDRHPEQAFVVDHIGKPEIRSDAFDKDWAENIRELARRDNVACKLSGMVTEVRGATWDTNLLRPYFETVLDAFGPRRLLSGSDWPVCLLRTPYHIWSQTVTGLIGDLTTDEKNRILGETAAEIYSLDIS